MNTLISSICCAFILSLTVRGKLTTGRIWGPIHDVDSSMKLLQVLFGHLRSTFIFTTRSTVDLTQFNENEKTIGELFLFPDSRASILIYQTNFLNLFVCRLRLLWKLCWQFRLFWFVVGRGPADLLIIATVMNNIAIGC